MNPKAVAAGDGKHLNVLGDSVRVILNSEDTGGALALMEQHGVPGSGVPMHVHVNDNEIFQIFEGELEFQVGQQTIRATPGSVVFAPHGVPHSFRVVGTQPARFQVMAMPGGLEKMLDEIAAMKGPPGPEALAALCSRYGVNFLPPEG